MEVTTKSADETKNVGRKFAATLTPAKNARVIALEGGLGGGKTTFVQGMAEGLGFSGRLISPTFILLRKYLLKSPPFNNLYHVDLYRLENDVDEEIENLGIPEIFKDPGSIIVIEWAEKAKKFLPQAKIWIKFIAKDKNSRDLIIQETK